MGYLTLDTQEKYLGDVTNDGKILMDDVVHMSRFVLGHIKTISYIGGDSLVDDIDADSKADIQVGTIAGQPGQTVMVPVQMVLNPGIAGAAFTVSYNKDTLTLLSIDKTMSSPMEHSVQTRIRD